MVTHSKQTKQITGRSGCTVLALAHAANISIEQADEIATAAGRRKGRGFKSRKLIEAAKRRGLRFVKLRLKTRTLQRFALERPEGRFYVCKRGHALAVIDGKWSDSTTPASRIVLAWQFLGDMRPIGTDELNTISDRISMDQIDELQAMLP